MNDNDHGEQQLIRFDINAFRLNYAIGEASNDRGFDDGVSLMIHATPLTDLPGVPVDFCLIEIAASRDVDAVVIKTEPGTSPGIGFVTATKDGLATRMVMPADSAWNIAAAIESQVFTQAIITCEPITALGDQVFLRKVDFRPR